MIRAGCGTLDGALAHVAAGESQCGFCARAEAVARLEAEGMPSRPASAGRPLAAQVSAPVAAPVPVTAAEAARNAAIAATEMTQWELDHPENRHRRRDGRLQVISGGAA